MGRMRKAAPLLALLVVGVVAMQGEPLDSFADFVKYLASPVALGVSSSIILQVMRRVWPAIDDEWAFFGSVAIAVVIAIAAVAVEPSLVNLPPELEVYWPFVVWFMQQVWFWLMKDGFYKSSKVPA